MALVATLIANPSNPVLTPALGEAAFNAVDGAGLYWLADGVACDIALKDGTDRATALAALKTVSAVSRWTQRCRRRTQGARKS
jgi:phosphoserine phosphatase